MLKKFVKHGNSHAVIIDKAVLEILRIDPDTTQLEITTDGDVLIVTPIRDKKKQKELQSTLDKIDRKYGTVFKRLANK